MTITAVIAEYNPFHNGHDYMIKKAKEETGADYVIAVMSGCFTQRGIPGIADKFTRAKMAAACGADAVFELPVLFATAGAESFAAGAVSLLSGLSCVDYLAFGSESGDLSQFIQAADLLAAEPENFRTSVRKFQKLGFSYPKAFSLAVKETDVQAEDSLDLLSSPNNLLGLEYVKALKRLSPSIRPHTITRVGTGYHDEHITFAPESDSMIASASAIRTCLETVTGSIASVMPLLPEASYQIFAGHYGISTPITLNDFSLLLSYRLASETKDSLEAYLDVSGDLADRIIKYQDACLSFSDLISEIKHKQYTHTRINRALLHILLGITKADATLQQVPYARLLAMKKSASPLMKELKAHTLIPIITKAADAKSVLSPEALRLFSMDVSAANLYYRVASHKFKSTYQDDIRHRIELV